MTLHALIAVCEALSSHSMGLSQEMRVTIDPLDVTETSFFQLTGGIMAGARSSDVDFHLGLKGTMALISLAQAHREGHPRMLKLSAFSVCHMHVSTCKHRGNLARKTRTITSKVRSLTLTTPPLSRMHFSSVRTMTLLADTQTLLPRHAETTAM